MTINELKLKKCKKMLSSLRAGSSYLRGGGGGGRAAHRGCGVPTARHDLLCNVLPTLVGVPDADLRGQKAVGLAHSPFLCFDSACQTRLQTFTEHIQDFLCTPAFT